MKKLIPGFPEYEITDDGRVWSKPRIDRMGRLVRGKWLSPNRVGAGYLKVELRRECKPYRRYLHQLVLETFVGPCPDGMEACHYPDRNKENNCLGNLRWDTRAENNRDAVKHGTRGGEMSGVAILTTQQVRQVVYTYHTGLFTQQKIADQYGVSLSTINDIMCRKSWVHIWTK